MLTPLREAINDQCTRLGRAGLFDLSVKILNIVVQKIHELGLDTFDGFDEIESFGDDSFRIYEMMRRRCDRYLKTHDETMTAYVMDYLVIACNHIRQIHTRVGYVSEFSDAMNCFSLIFVMLMDQKINSQEIFLESYRQEIFYQQEEVGDAMVIQMIRTLAP